MDPIPRPADQRCKRGPLPSAPWGKELCSVGESEETFRGNVDRHGITSHVNDRDRHYMQMLPETRFVYIEQK
jgi:hypothetical protein